MKSKNSRSSLLCPNCKKLVGRTVSQCPYCHLKNPGSIWNNNIFTKGNVADDGILRVIIIANVVLFAASIVLSLGNVGFSASPFNLLSPSSDILYILGGSGRIPLSEMRWWTLLSANYLHGSLLHIVFNMFAALQLGQLLIQEYGRNRMVIIYTLSGVGGFLVSAMMGVPFTLGASAAVCGMIGAALYYGKSRGGSYGEALYRQIGAWAIFIFLFGFTVPGIDNWGHGGGFLSGLLLGYLLGYSEKKREVMVHRYLAMACIIVTCGVLAWSLFWGVVYKFLIL